jgi:hypothetical protein
MIGADRLKYSSNASVCRGSSVYWIQQAITVILDPVWAAVNACP